MARAMVRCSYRNSSQFSIGDEAGAAVGRPPRPSAGLKNRSQISLGLREGDGGPTRSVSPICGAARSLSPLSPSGLARRPEALAVSPVCGARPRRLLRGFGCPSPQQGCGRARSPEHAEVGGVSPERLLAGRLLGEAVPPPLRIGAASVASLAAVLRARGLGGDVSPAVYPWAFESRCVGASGRSAVASKQRAAGTPQPSLSASPSRGRRSPSRSRPACDDSVVPQLVEARPVVAVEVEVVPDAPVHLQSVTSRIRERPMSPQPPSPRLQSPWAAGQSQAPLVPPLQLSRVATSALRQRSPSAAAQHDQLVQRWSPSQSSRPRCSSCSLTMSPSQTQRTSEMELCSRRSALSEHESGRVPQFDPQPQFAPSRASRSQSTSPLAQPGRCRSSGEERCLSPCASRSEVPERRACGSVWVGPPPPQRADNLTFARGSQALPSGEMQISGTTQGDHFRTWQPCTVARPAVRTCRHACAGGVLPEGQMRIEGTTYGDIGGMYTYKGAHGCAG